MSQVTLIDANLTLSLSYTQNVRDICKPLFDNTIITYFNFARKYNDGSNISLSTNPEWAKCYYESGLYKVMDDDTDIDTFRRKEEKEGLRNFFRLEFQSCIAGQTSEKFGVETDLAMIMLSSEYCDYYFFGANPTARMEDRINLYIKNSDIFPHFIFYFHEKAEKIINNMHERNNRILVPNKELHVPGNTIKVISEEPSFKDKLLKEIEIQQYRFVIKNKEIFLTKREAECLTLLARGKSLKYIANRLNLSVRTIETHVEKIKIKLDCRTTSQVIDFAAATSDGYSEEIKSNMLAI